MTPDIKVCAQLAETARGELSAEVRTALVTGRGDNGHLPKSSGMLLVGYRRTTLKGEILLRDAAGSPWQGWVVEPQKANQKDGKNETRY
jgi:hypothetical protein